MDRKGYQVKVSITTLGCKSNQYDSFAIEDMLRENNIRIVESDHADACIINTCTVTGSADSQSRQLIRGVRKRNPHALLIVTGCYAQVSPEEVSGMDGVDYVVGNNEKGEILAYLSGRKGRDNAGAGTARDGDRFGLRAKGAGGRTRAYLKVQDGCDNSCSYCIIPTARGRGRSLPASEVLREIEALQVNGFKEIVITGIHLGSYGADLGRGTDMAGLLAAIEREGYPCRFRISSLDPEDVTDELIEIFAASKTICRHIHLSVQSGDERIITLMNRRNSPALLKERVTTLKERVESIAIGVDIIAGFPGEGEEEFNNTRALLSELPISYMHIFPFSKRRGTAASELRFQIDGRTIKERCRILRSLDRKKRREFYGGFSGKRMDVLVESRGERREGIRYGRTDNYIPVSIEGYRGEGNRMVPVVLGDAGDDGMTGRWTPFL